MASGLLAKNKGLDMKIELDLVNGMAVVDTFAPETTVMDSDADIRDYLKDQIVGCLGFEVSKQVAMEVLADGYSIAGFNVMIC